MKSLTLLVLVYVIINSGHKPTNRRQIPKWEGVIFRLRVDTADIHEPECVYNFWFGSVTN